MSGFEIPDWAIARPADAPPPPPPDPAALREQQIADNTRAEQALNGFIAGKQAALFEAPDAFYRTEGDDAIHAAPVILGTLSRLRDDSLDGLANDAQRNRLGQALDAHLQLARGDITRHVAEQSLAWQRKVAQDRIALLTKEAAQHHCDDGLVDAIGHAAGTAARAHARVGNIPPDQQVEDAAAATARSGVLGAAIQARLDRGDTAGANALFTQVQDQLDPEHAAPLQGQIEQAQTPPLLVHPEIVGPATIEPEAATPGPDEPASAEIGPAPAAPESGDDVDGLPSETPSPKRPISAPTVALPGANENGQPGASRPTADIWDRPSGPQQQAVDAILDQNVKRAEVTTDPKVRDAIVRGLTSADAQERAKWARVPLDEYKPYLSDSDFRALADQQRQISPYDGTPREGVGHPIGTLDQNAEAAIALTPGRLLRPILGAGRAALGKSRSIDKSGIEDAVPSLVEPPVAAGPKPSTVVRAPEESPPNHPPNFGFEGESKRLTLEPGTRIDRYGGTQGKFLSPQDTPIGDRALPHGSESRTLNVYEVVRPIEVQGGTTMPWYGQRGGGVQYYLGRSTVQDLIDSGHLRPIK